VASSVDAVVAELDELDAEVFDLSHTETDADRPSPPKAENPQSWYPAR
jgi:hypothetical protein